MSQQPPQYQLYRESSLGRALTDTLDDLIQDSLLDPQTAMQVLGQFDASISEALHAKVRSRATLKGHLHVYRFCDDVWTFVVDSANFRLENETVVAEKVKVVACNALNRQVGGIISEIEKCLDNWEMISENSLLRIREASNNRLKLAKALTEESIPKWDLYNMETKTFDKLELEKEFQELSGKLDDTANKFQVQYNKIILSYFKYQEVIRDAASSFGPNVLEREVFNGKLPSEVDYILHEAVDNLKKEFALINTVIERIKNAKQLQLNHALVFVSIWTHRPYFTKLDMLLDAGGSAN
ncbi:Transcription initiation factor IIA small chain (TFIIA 13.5 kDa subunit) [Boothiomyces sp. JEL0838]|nr:Transcription initiation factor IIA small chain (TFIIA 13.5 kDa subunit) [Boothiomyces sp. JEL0838]